MTHGDQPRFAAVMAKLAAVFSHQLSHEASDGYWLALEDMGIAQLETAAKRALRELKWFPRPSELREFAGMKSRREPTPSYLLPWRSERKRSARERGWPSK